MIIVKELHKTFYQGFWRRPQYALRGINLNVPAGSLFGFIGPNGAGKSTTIKLILGLLRKTSGEIQLMARDPRDPQSRAQVGFLPEQPYFYDYLSGREVLRLYGKLLGLNGPSLEKRISECCELVKASESWLDRKLRSYSKGMLQRIGLAQALLSKPKLLILDEPMSGLDPMGRRDIRILLQNLHSEGTTIFYSSHVLSDVETICTGVAMIIQGEIRRSGTVHDVVGEEGCSYLVRVRDWNRDDKLPSQCNLIEGGRIHCENEEAKEELFRLVMEKGIKVEHLEGQRSSLEDVLAQEVAKVHG